MGYSVGDDVYVNISIDKSKTIFSQEAIDAGKLLCEIHTIKLEDDHPVFIGKVICSHNSQDLTIHYLKFTKEQINE